MPTALSPTAPTPTVRLDPPPVSLPRPRGPLSEDLVRCLQDRTDPAAVRRRAERVAAAASDFLRDDDGQLTLALLYELHYRGLPGVDDRWEWQPDLVGAAASLEAVFERELRALVASRLPAEVDPAQIPAVLATLIRDADGPSLSKYMARHATREQWVEFLVHRSIYHLKEADPHSFAIPRLGGAPKVALVEINSDEYGGGRPEWMHATLFARTMAGLGLDSSYGRYLDVVPAITLAWANAMTLFGLHRRLRGAVVGHLAVLEMSSSLPNRRYGNGLRRLGLDPATTLFFDEHVEADAVHEQIAAHDLAGRLARSEPDLAPDILFGATVALSIDAEVATYLLAAWQEGQSSLRSERQPIA